MPRVQSAPRRRTRPLTALPGNPTVIVAAHPTKNAAEDQLIPYGAGAILNEVDGNLTLWRKPDTSIVHLHWQGKLRGLEFPPRPFRFEIIGSPDILDVKGRQVQLPVIRPSSETDDEEREAANANLDKGLLRAMLASPEATQAEWGAAIGEAKGNINKRLQRLQKGKLVDKALNRWLITSQGKKALDPSKFDGNLK